jgi:hypothetical protein
LIPIKEEIMSKRILAVTLAFGILATSNAFASRARVSVLGSGDAGAFLSGGSFFYDDARNIFYNPSYVNDFKNWGIIEKSNGMATGVQAGTNSQAEGGFVTSMGAFNLGIYLNRMSAVTNNVANMATLANQRPLELMFGGDMGTAKWGLGLTYAAANGGGQSDTNLILRAGAQVADFEPFGWATLVGKEAIATGGGDGNKYKSYGVGLRYKMGEWIPFLGWRQDKVTVATVDVKASSWLLGLGRTTKIGEGARMNYSAAVVRATNGAGAPTGRTVIPVNVSVEADANTWLTARAGLGHNLYDRADDATSGANTTGRLGFGIHVGKADLDFAVGKSGTAFARAETGTELDAQVFDISNAFFSQASVSYHW